MSSTKQKILDAALKLFNENGLVNVRLQHIADEAFVSVGNLAYHYANKETIVMALFTQLIQQQKAVLAEYRTVPLFDYMDRLFQNIFSLQQSYIFYYLDALEISRAYPEIATVRRQHLEWQIAQLQHMLEFNVSRGAMVAEPLEGIYHKLAVQIWMNAELWPVQRTVRGMFVGGFENYRMTLWALCYPYFTRVGQLEYQQMLNAPEGF